MSIGDAESMKEYVARAKSLASMYSITTLRYLNKRLAAES